MTAAASAPPPDDLDDLVRRSRAGSVEAFTGIVRLHQRSVRVYLARALYRRDLVDDLAQDVFVTAFRRIGEFRGEAAVGSWLLGIARMTLANHFRDERRRRDRDHAAGAEILAFVGEAALDNDWHVLAAHERRTAALEDCLKRLPPHEAELVRQHYKEGRAAAEIATADGRNPGAVRMTLLRIRKALRRCVQMRLAREGA